MLAGTLSVRLRHGKPRLTLSPTRGTEAELFLIAPLEVRLAVA
jgi:hypothetical protein